MNINVLLTAVSLGLFSLGQAFSCEPPPTSESSPSDSPPLTQSPESGVGEEGSPQPIAPEPLPRLSDAEIEALQADVTQNIDTWFGLAGVDKVVDPPPFTDALQDYRDAWSAVNVDVATFLGSWHDSEGYSYSLNVFPSRTPGQVCVLEFRPEWSLYILNEATGELVKDMIAEQILTFSVATVEDGHLRSSQVRSVGSATVLTTYGVGEGYPVMFMGVMDDQDTSRVVALSASPGLPGELPEALVGSVSQTLYDYGCITDLVPSGE